MNQIPNLNAALQSLMQNATSATASLSDVASAMDQLNNMRSQTTDTAQLAQIQRTQEAITASLEKRLGIERELTGAAKDTVKEYAEGEKKIKEQTSAAKVLLGTFKEVGTAVRQLNRGDLGGFVGTMTQGIPVVQQLGMAVDGLVTAFTKAVNQQQALRKAIIDGQAAVGQFGQAMSMTDRDAGQFTQNMSKYATAIGVNRDQLTQYTTQLGQMGFSLQEMGFDDQMSMVSSLGSVMEGTAGKVGVLDAAIRTARATGLDTGKVFEQMQFQVKELGQTSGQTQMTLLAVSKAAGQAGVSTQRMLMPVRRLQDQFKFLGIDSTKATLQLGKVGEAAAKVGLGQGTAIDLAGQAIGGLANMNFGRQAFFGQRMGMGGGLSAGFRFREQTGDRGLSLVQGVTQQINEIFGGAVSLAQAQSSESAAARRVAQEQFAGSTFGLNQVESGRLLDLMAQLEGLDGGSDQAKVLEKEIANLTRTDKDYYAKTLSIQERIAMWLDLIATTLSKAVLTFLKGVTGDSTAGKNFDEILKGMREGSLDASAFDDLMRGAASDIEGAILPFAKNLGESFRSLYQAIEPLLPYLMDWKVILGGLATAKLSGMAVQGTMMRGAVQGLAGEAAGEAGESLLGRIFGRGRGKERAVQGFSAAIKRSTGLLSKLGGGLLKAAGPLAAVAAAAGAAKIAFDHLIESSERRLEGENAAAAATNKALSTDDKFSIAGQAKALREQLGISVEELSKMRTSLLTMESDKRREYIQSLSDKQRELLEKELTRFKIMMTQGIGGESTGRAAAARTQTLMDIQATREMLNPGDAVKDAWNIKKSGWLFASPGDVVIDSKSLGQAASSGVQGDGIGAMINALSPRASSNIFGPRAGSGAMQAQEIPVKVVLELVEDKLGMFIQKEIMTAVHSDQIRPGKRGASKAEQHYGGSVELG